MIKINNWKKLIDNCTYDELVGIKIAKLTGDDNFSTFITEIGVNKSVNQHYHKHGDEHYHIISGLGQIYLKNIITNKETSQIVRSQESFIVQENVLHKLTNIGSSTLILMFSCPTSHLESDRFLL